MEESEAGPFSKNAKVVGAENQPLKIIPLKWSHPCLARGGNLAHV